MSVDKEILEAIKSSSNVLVASHVNPDSDAYGSMIGLGLALKKFGKNVDYYNETKLDEYYSFIPEVSLVKNTFDSKDYELLIICDCADSKRVGKALFSKLKEFKTVINIDHHKSNDSFAHLNLVHDKASSTCEMIANLVSDTLEIEYDNDIAICLIAGIYGDTGSLKYPCTSVSTINVVANLKAKCDGFDDLMKDMFSSNTISSVKLEAEVFSKIDFFENNTVASIEVPLKLIEKYSAKVNDTEGFVEKLRDIKGVKCAILIKENADFKKLSLRSEANSYDVAVVAQAFGGGGHRNASGFSSKKTFSEIKKLVLEELKKQI